MNIAVLGAGNWGTTAALLLYRNGHRVRLWEFNETLAHEMTERRENRVYLPGFPIPHDLLVTHVLSEAVNDAESVIFVVPSEYMRQTARTLKKTGALCEKAILVSLSKGLEHDTLLTMTGVIGEEIEGHPLVAMSGPCIASEVARGLPTTIVSASKDIEASRLIQDAFMSPSFRVYTSGDPLGIQLGGALKNIIAIAAGISDGLGFGTNAKSALITRGIVEMRRFGAFLGASPETFNGLSGIGDLITTCFSGYSRNRRVGDELAKGKTLQDILAEMIMVAEGVPTTRTVFEFSLRNSVEMPITDKVYSVLFGSLSPESAVTELMIRDRKPEYHSS
jgi:glycerol-3-phosphate dehydrogenase (NAD(P)+)